MGDLPQVWGANEEVRVFLVLDNTEIDTGLTVFFTSPDQLASLTGMSAQVIFYIIVQLF